MSTKFWSLGMVFAALLAIGCSSSTTSTGSGSGSPSPSTSDAGKADSAMGTSPITAGGDGGTTPTAQGCGVETGLPACDTCLSQKCCTPIDACSDEADCVALDECLSKCTQANGQACGDACFQAHPKGAPLVDAIDQCVETNCKTACAG